MNPTRSSTLGTQRDLYTPQRAASRHVAAISITAAALLVASPCWAKEIYIAATAAGADSGADCGDAHASTFFNTSSNWGGGATQVGPGDTVHVCGTITTPPGTNALTFQGSGATGQPITLLFEPDAVLTSPYWGSQTGAAIVAANGKSYITIDGGSNGLIEATANGSTLANQQDGTGVFASSCDHCAVQNLNISNLYVHTSLADENGQNSNGILFSGNDAVIAHNTIHDVKWCASYSYPGSTQTANVEIYGNTSYACDHGIVVGSGNVGAAVTNVSVHDNIVHDPANWDDAQNGNHHDGIHTWAVHAMSSITGMSIYNNRMYGAWGTHFNSFIYEEGHVVDVNTFNNVLSATSANCGYGLTGVAGQGLHAQNVAYYNNTITGAGTASCSVITIEDADGVTIENNIGSAASGLIGIPAGSTITAIDYDDWFDFYAGGAPFNILGNVYSASTGASAFSQYQGASHYDAHGLYADPMLDAMLRPMQGSPAIHTGKDLSSLNIAALNVDRAGVARQPGAWDMGAYQFCAGSECTPVDAGVDGATQGDDAGPGGDASVPGSGGGGGDLGYDAGPPGAGTPEGGDGAPARSGAASGCGCRAAGGDATPYGAVSLLGIVGAVVAARRRKRAVPADA